MGVTNEIDARTGGGDWISSSWDALRTSFGFLAGVAMIAAVVVGIVLPAIDNALGIDLPILAFESQSSARSILETIGTTTVAVAGLSFSVTVVAFTLASSQLSPLVLRSFRGDRMSQATLAILLGTFVYSLILLVRLGVAGEGTEPPHLSVTLAILLALVSFGMFAGFIGHIVSMLQPSSVIEAIHAEAIKAMTSRYPSGVGEPDDAAAAAGRAKQRIDESRMHEITADDHGYLTLVNAGPLIEAARSDDALVGQRVELGDYVLPGQVLAEVWADEVDDEFEASVRDAFSLGKQRTMVQDEAFPIRQFADIALKGLSPGINDPTTAENAVEAMSAVLIEFLRAERPAAVRVDADGEPRLLASGPELDDLVRLGFDQVRVCAGPHPVVSARLLELLDRIESAAAAEELDVPEIKRQRRLIAIGIGEDGPTEDEAEAVRTAAASSGTV